MLLFADCYYLQIMKSLFTDFMMLFIFADYDIIMMLSFVDSDVIIFRF